MKTLYKFIFVLILLPFYSKAGVNNEKFPHSKEKTISKTYIVNPDATTQISNSYGAISVQLWDENKISITAKITVSGKKESTVNEKIDDISVDFTDTTVSLISAKTIFPSNKSWGLDWNKSDVSYEVNYVVLIPKRGNVVLYNNYGNILISKLNGSSIIKCNYGNVIAGDLTGNNNFTLNYSDNSKINYVNKLSCNANYSELATAKGESISTSGNYNKFHLSNIDKVHSTGSYNDYNFKNIGNFNCSGNYVNMNFSNVETSALSINYAQLNFTADTNFKNTSITANYSSIKINVPAALSFDFDIRCMYGSLKTDLDLDYSSKSAKNNINQYKGARNSSGKSKFGIITNYGSVQIQGK
ncbi:hypothetical protein [Flavobacterium sp. H122]|uniref:hypothetical protein n=1 Tax=Flavobacterium sp. H122 TaxID=2529860 RepID=UPI0010AA7037|nr:hypothetical protein [Flavobacterium sp. H122]